MENQDSGLQDLLGDDIERHLFLNWLDYLPRDYAVRNVEDILIILLGISKFSGDILCKDELKELHEVVASKPNGFYLALEDGEAVISDLDTDTEFYRAQVPDWLLKLDGLIDFLVYGWQRFIRVHELRDVLMQIWNPII